MNAANGSGTAGSPLARRLRELREKEWTDRTLTQAELAAALGTAPATVSSWESLTSPKTPTTARLTTYAQFFASRRSMDAKPPSRIPVADLTDGEQQRFEQLKKELFGLHDDAVEKDVPVDEPKRRQLLQFEGTGPVVIVCPELPEEICGRLASEKNVNHTRLHGFADADALLQVFGHIRAMNPERSVFHRLPSEMQRDDLQHHIVLLGGIAWNKTMRRMLSDLDENLPIEQVEDERVPDGEVFKVKATATRDEQTHLPVLDSDGDEIDLVEDVGLLARLPNSFNSGRTMTICNGIHSRGVLGAVLAITDETVRPNNEKYLAHRFPQDSFAMLIRVPVVFGQPIAPDLQNRHTRLFEWEPEPKAGE